MCYIPDSRNNWTQTIKHEDIGVLGNLIWCVLAEKMASGDYETKTNSD